MPGEGGAQPLHHRIGVVPFDGGHLPPFARHRERNTGPHRRSVDQHRAGAADAMFATEVGAGQARLIPQEIPQMHARGRLVRHALAVYFQCHLNHGFSCQPTACTRQRGTAVPCSLRWCSSLSCMTPASSLASSVSSMPASPCCAMRAAN
ncbi:hypothetical protein G6F22_016908 [Rhizopus arrhizus]|nr:hypothetical protein G6F22_016908 [Rhizopus arrhizus]